MMATLSLILTSLLYLTLCQTTLADDSKCTTQDECSAGMCCVHNPLTNAGTGKRFVYDEYNQHDHGYCRREMKLNETCWSLGRDSQNPNLYEFYCPCESGLECRNMVVQSSTDQVTRAYPLCQPTVSTR